MLTLDAAYVRAALPRRDPEGHKGDFGKVYVLGGSVGYTGAPVFCSRAAVRSGCGLVLLGVPSDICWTESCVCRRRRTSAAAPPGAMPWLWAAAWDAARRATGWCAVC